MKIASTGAAFLWDLGACAARCAVALSPRCPSPVLLRSGYRGDLAYAGVLASLLGGILVSRLRAPALARTMLATSVAELLGLHGMFVVGFAASGVLFLRSDRTA